MTVYSSQLNIIKRNGRPEHTRNHMGYLCMQRTRKEIEKKRRKIEESVRRESA